MQIFLRTNFISLVIAAIFIDEGDTWNISMKRHAIAAVINYFT